MENMNVNPEAEQASNKPSKMKAIFAAAFAVVLILGGVYYFVFGQQAGDTPPSLSGPESSLYQGSIKSDVGSFEFITFDNAEKAAWDAKIQQLGQNYENLKTSLPFGDDGLHFMSTTKDMSYENLIGNIKPEGNFVITNYISRGANEGVNPIGDWDMTENDYFTSRSATVGINYLDQNNYQDTSLSEGQGFIFAIDQDTEVLDMEPGSARSKITYDFCGALTKSNKAGWYLGKLATLDEDGDEMRITKANFEQQIPCSKYIETAWIQTDKYIDGSGKDQYFEKIELATNFDLGTDYSLVWVYFNGVPVVEATPGTLQFSSAAYGVNENVSEKAVTITVKRVGGSNGEASVDYVSANLTATSPNDYTATTSTLTWNDGDTADKTFTVPIHNDAEIEGDETFELTLENAIGADIGSPDVSTVTIVDDDDPKSEQPDNILQFFSDTYDVDEDAGTVTVTVERIGNGNDTVSVDYISTGKTAKAGVDYNTKATPETEGTLTWADGDMTNKTFTVDINNDADIEGDETFELTLENAIGTTSVTNIGGLGISTVTIIDDDGALPPGTAAGTLQFSSATYDVDEDVAAKAVTITVTRIDGSDGAVSVDYVSTNGTATIGSDYTAVNNTLTWANGETADKTFTIPINNDSDAEGDETFELILEKESSGVTIGNPGVSTVTIVDDDSAPAATAGTLQFSSPTYNVDEDGKQVTITVERVDGSDGDVSVRYTSIDGTTTTAVDYTAVNDTLTWASGETISKTFTVDILNDTVAENDETFQLGLTNESGNATIGNPSVATVNITDDDGTSSGPGTLQFSSATYDVNENVATGMVTATVKRIGGDSGAVSVNYTSGDGTGATAPEDYAAVDSSLTWADGDSTDRTFTVKIIDDNITDDNNGINETFGLTLTSPTGNATLGNPSISTVTIIDDEGPGTIQFSEPEYNVNENGGTIQIIVSRTVGSNGIVSIDYVSTDGTATLSDYDAVGGTLTWNNGDTADKIFIVTILDDSIVEGNETLELTLHTTTGGATLGAIDIARVTIVDDE